MRDHDAVHRRPATDRLADAGPLAERATLMHAAAVTDRDVERFAAAGLTVNHNPLGNALLGFGVAHHQAIRRLTAADVPGVLGSDTAPSMLATPFELIRAALTTARDAAADDTALGIEDALRMATNCGAVLGRPGQLGVLTRGRLADLVPIDASGPWHLGDRHPVPTLALRARESDLRTVIVDGKVVVDDGKHCTLDERDVAARADGTLRSLARAR